MKRHRRAVIACTTTALLLCAGLSAGCNLANFNLNFVVPLGLGGSPGMLNPFGIVQALVNAMLGVGADGTGSGGATPGTNTAPPDSVDPAVTVAL